MANVSFFVNGIACNIYFKIPKTFGQVSTTFSVLVNSAYKGIKLSGSNTSALVGESTRIGTRSEKELLAFEPKAPSHPTISTGRPQTPAEEAASAKYLAWREANGGADFTYLYNQIRKDNISIVENSPTNFFPVISNLKKAGRYELMGMHEEAKGALKDAGVEVALGYGTGKVFGYGLKYFRAPGTTTVYVSVSNGVTQYVGITNNLARRAAQHLAKKGINIEPLMQGLSRSDARAVEQALIEIHGLMKKGGTLLNRINSIGPNNPAYKSQLERGYELLKSIGYQ